MVVMRPIPAVTFSAFHEFVGPVMLHEVLAARRLGGQALIISTRLLIMIYRCS